MQTSLLSNTTRFKIKEGQGSMRHLRSYYHFVINTIAATATSTAESALVVTSQNTAAISSSAASTNNANCHHRFTKPAFTFPAIHSNRIQTNPKSSPLLTLSSSSSLSSTLSSSTSLLLPLQYRHPQHQPTTSLRHIHYKRLFLTTININAGRLFSTNTTPESTSEDQEELQQQNQQQQTLFTPDFASSYHAPVMPKECIDALLRRSHHSSGGKKNKYKHLKYKKKTNELQQQQQMNKGSTNSDVNAKHDDMVAATDESQEKEKPRIFIDGTLGGGGHSQYLLQNLNPNDIVIGCDVDPSALSTASQRLVDYMVIDDCQSLGAGGDDKIRTKPIFIPVQSNFKNLQSILLKLVHPITGKTLLGRDGSGGEGGVDGILLDLGVSSHQIDNPERGFAFMKDGPLDMRMGNGDWNNKVKNNKSYSGGDVSSDEDNHLNGITKTTTVYGLTAANICNEFTEADLTQIFRTYGDEPRARKIAQSIIDHRPLSKTSDLYNAVAAVTPEFAKKGRRMGRTATLARIFQSLRIVVNEEDKALEGALMEMAPSLINAGGRLVVLSYHSMEDRAVKRVMRDGSIHKYDRVNVEKDLFGNIVDSGGGSGRPWKPLGKKMKATEGEIEVNSRARSATLRVAERLP